MKINQPARAFTVSTTDRNLTAHAGAVLIRAAAHAVGLSSAIGANLRLKKRARGLTEGESFIAIAEAIALGATCLDDLAVARADHAQRELRGFAVPAPQTAGSFLRRFTIGHIGQLNKRVGVLKRNLRIHNEDEKGPRHLQHEERQYKAQRASAKEPGADDNLDPSKKRNEPTRVEPVDGRRNEVAYGRDADDLEPTEPHEHDPKRQPQHGQRSMLEHAQDLLVDGLETPPRCLCDLSRGTMQLLVHWQPPGPVPLRVQPARARVYSHGRGGSLLNSLVEDCGGTNA